MDLLIPKPLILDAPKHNKVVCPSHNHMQRSARKKCPALLSTLLSTVVIALGLSAVRVIVGIQLSSYQPT